MSTRKCPGRLPLSPLLLAPLLLACSGENTPPNVEAPGAEKSGKSQVLEAGAALLQDKTPLGALNVYVDGFHFYNGNLDGQMEAHHYCTQLNEELIQCVIFDGNTRDAKLMGVEYIVSERLFKGLPEDEKKLWHSHVHEVMSGTLIAPGIPDVAEHELMEKLVGTYGKTWHTWHTDRPELTVPLGSPALMMGFTKDGQLEPALLADRDKRFNISSEEKRRQRADIPAPPIQPGANAWEKGEVRQIQPLTSIDAHKHGPTTQPLKAGDGEPPASSPATAPSPAANPAPSP